MAYSENLLPKSAAYYFLNRASIEGTDLNIDAGGYAEINVSQQMLPKLTEKMLIVVHPSVFSDYYTNDAIQVTLSIITTDGERIELLVPVSEHSSGVFNTEIELPDEEYVMFTYRIYSSVPVTVYNWELCSLESADVTVDIEGIEQELPKLLYDYNTYSYAVGQKELTVGLISCFLLEKTDLQGHFTISFFATERCNVHVRIKDNGVTELFSPQVYTVERGYASISIPHAYLKKTATDHSFSVTLQCTNGQLSIPVRGMLYTIDGGYLATRLLDAGIDVQDISIKQLSSDMEPSEIFAVGYESTHLLLKSRAYSQLQRVNWNALKDFGEGIAAAVEFNGSWVFRKGSDRYTIETEATPFVFIVDTNNVLKVYTGSDYDEVVELDTDVTSVAACRGFNSMQYIEEDQGLIVTYIKNGNVYYRQYLYDTNKGEYRWFGNEALYENGDASFVSVHRLPDYRVGICVTHSTGTKWYITDRTYVTQGFKPEIINASVASVGIATVRELTIADVDYSTATINSFEAGEDYYNGFIMTFPYKLAFIDNKNISNLRQNITVHINGILIEDAIKEFTIIDNVISVVLRSDVRSGRTVAINLNCMYLVTFVPNGCFTLTTQSYTWRLPAPTVYASEELSIGAEGTISALVKSLTTTSLTQQIEEVNIDVSPEFTCKVGQIKTRSIDTQKETIGISTTSDIDITVSIVGVTPI